MNRHDSFEGNLSYKWSNVDAMNLDVLVDSWLAWSHLVVLGDAIFVCSILRSDNAFERVDI